MTLDELRNKISIIEIAEHYGYKIQKGSGVRTPMMKHEESNDKIGIFNPTDIYNQRYFSVRNDSDKGGLYAFVKNRIESGIIPNRSSYSIVSDTYKCVTAVLYDYLNIPVEERCDVKDVVSDLKSRQQKPVEDFTAHFAPLTHKEFLCARGFSEKVLSDPLFEGRIGNITESHDTAFPIFNAEGKMIGLEKRNKNIKLFVAGSQRSIGVWHSNIPETIEKVLITESPLDCIAHHQMMPNANTLYIAHGGNLCQGQIETINTLLHSNIKKVDLKRFEYLLGADNDQAGVSYDLALIKNQLSMKAMKFESSQNGNVKTLIIHEGGFVGFEKFCDILSRHIKNKDINYLLREKDEKCFLRISYPSDNMSVERDLCVSILNTGILPFTKLEKAVLKDWNDDLKRIKEISKKEKRYITHEEFAAKKEYHGEEKENIISNNKTFKKNL